MKLLSALIFFISSHAIADTQLTKGMESIKSRAGCYVVDYSFFETKSVKPGYEQDHRVYDPNRNKTVYEWIYAEELSPTRVWIQHILFHTDPSGKLITDSLLKHTGEDWRYNAEHLYDFTGPMKWNVVKPASGTWTRAITNLDDGLRYQCAAAFDLKTASPEWTCDDYSPIPGREYRDFKRSDYNTLQRSSKIVTYAPNWIERETNTKIIDKEGKRTPLADEVGKTWYVKVADSECKEAKAYAEARQPFWGLLRATWDEVLDGKAPFTEKVIKEAPRFAEIFKIEDKYCGKDLKKDSVRASAREEILSSIKKYRVE